MPKTLIRLGAIMMLVSLAAVAVFLIHQPDEPARLAALPAEPQKAEVTSPVSPADQPEIVDDQRRDRAAHLLGEARRLAADGKVAEAEKALERAEKARPGLTEIDEMRHEFATLATPQGRLKERLQRARLALEHDDRAAARQALNEAEALSPDAPQVVEIRQALRAVDQEEARRHARVSELIGRMRDAVARGDFAAAHGALNEAERIDLQAPSIARARRHLAQAEDRRG
jgi:hypothetical protein